MADSSNTANAPYTVSAASLGHRYEHDIDQRITPTHSILGSGWQRKGIYQVSSYGTTNLCQSEYFRGKVVADAVCLLEVTPASSNTFNAAGNVVASANAKGYVTTYEYDTLNRLVKVTSPDADGSSVTTTDIPVAKYVYDAAGQMIESRQGAVNTGITELATAYRYDYLGRRTAVLLPDPDHGGGLRGPPNSATNTTSWATSVSNTTPSATRPSSFTTPSAD